MAEPFISVIINNFNYGRFLGQAVSRALEQDFPESRREIIVVDDGSTDESREVIESFAGRIRPIYQSNQGQAAAMNKGMAAAQGDILCLLDSDDWWRPEKLSRVAQRFEDPDLGMVQNWTQEVDRDLSPLPGTLPSVPAVYRLKDFLQGPTYFTGTSGLSFNSAVRGILPIPETLFYCADEYLFTQILFRAAVGNIPEVLGYRRVHGANRYALLYRDPKKLENHLKVRRILDGSLEARLKASGQSLSPLIANRRRLEVLQEELFLHRYQCRLGLAAAAWREMGRLLCGGYAAFKLATLLLALISPRLYLSLYDCYCRWSPVRSARRSLLKESR